MFLQDSNQLRIRLNRLSRTGASVVVAASACLGVTGCGWGVANLAPAATKSVPGVPSGPILGYVFSATDGTLRPVLGVKGSSQLGQSIVPAGVYVAGAASVTGSAGLLEDERGSLFAFNLPLSQPMHVADGLPDHAQIAFASSGQSAIAYLPGASAITLITGLPTQPQSRSVALPASVKVASAVVSDARTIVVAAQGTPMQIGVAGANGQFSLLAAATEIGGMNFLPASEDVLIADRGKNTVSLLHNVSSSPTVEALNVAGMNQPLAVAASQDRRWAVVANGGDQNVLRIDLRGGNAVSRLTCACQPTQLSSLAGNSTFRLNALGSGPLWMVDLGGVAPQLLFVPAMTQGNP